MRYAPEARDELEARLHSLVAALVTAADPPPDMDAGRIRAQAVALMHKRSRAVARAQPELAAALGLDFGPAFHAYCKSRPGVSTSGTAVDARQFARHLLRSSFRDRDVRRVARRVARRWRPDIHLVRRW